MRAGHNRRGGVGAVPAIDLNHVVVPADVLHAVHVSDVGDAAGDVGDSRRYRDGGDAVVVGRLDRAHIGLRRGGQVAAQVAADWRVHDLRRLEVEGVADLLGAGADVVAGVDRRVGPEHRGAEAVGDDRVARPVDIDHLTFVPRRDAGEIRLRRAAGAANVLVRRAGHHRRGVIHGVPQRLLGDPDIPAGYR